MVSVSTRVLLPCGCAGLPPADLGLPRNRVRNGRRKLLNSDFSPPALRIVAPRPLARHHHCSIEPPKTHTPPQPPTPPPPPLLLPWIRSSVKYNGPNGKHALRPVISPLGPVPSKIVETARTLSPRIHRTGRPALLRPMAQVCGG